MQYMRRNRSNLSYKKRNVSDFGNPIEEKLKSRRKIEKFHKGVIEGKIYFVKLLVEEEGVNVNARDEYKCTALHWASENGHLDIVKYLVESGADINAKDYSGWTPLHVAAWNGRLDVVKYLLKHEADVYSKNISGKTPCDVATPRVRKYLKRYMK